MNKHKENKKPRSVEGKLITITAPAWNENDNLEEFCQQVIHFVKKKTNNYEIIIVENGSSDNSLELLKELNKNNKNIQYIKLTRNFGYYGGLIAGMENSNGDLVITMDADLQHPPELIPNMIEKWQEGYDIVGTIKISNQQIGVFRKTFNKIFYGIMELLSGIPKNFQHSDYRLLDKKALKALITLPEKQKYIRGLAFWIGFKQKYINFEAPNRTRGETSFNAITLFSFALNGLFSFSIVPLRLILIFGLIVSFFCAIITFYSLAEWIFGWNNLPPRGWLTLLIGIYFLGGIQLISIGLLGEYLGQNLSETRKRPSYIIEETNLGTK